MQQADYQRDGQHAPGNMSTPASSQQLEDNGANNGREEAQQAAEDVVVYDDDSDVQDAPLTNQAI